MVILILHSPFSTGHKGVSTFLHEEAILLALFPHSPFSEEVWQPLMLMWLIVDLPFPCLWLCGCRIHGPCGHRLLRSGQIQRHRWGLPLDRKPLWRPKLICVLGRLPPNGEGQHYCKQPVPRWRPRCDQPHEFEAAAGFVNPPIEQWSPRRNLVVDMRN